MIAIALICGPRVLVADEPTTALDVTIQAQILDVMRTLVRDRGTSIVLITHDMGVVADIADHVAVMYAGRIAEIGPVDAIFARPRHPYTALLLASVPRARRAAEGQSRDDRWLCSDAVGVRRRMPLFQPLPAGFGGVPARATATYSSPGRTIAPPAGISTGSLNCQELQRE